MADMVPRPRFFPRIDTFRLTVFEYIIASEQYSKLFDGHLFTYIGRKLYKGEISKVGVHFKISIYSEHFRVGPMLVGMFQPFVDMANDAIDTFYPYTTGREVLDDVLQPLYGVGNILKALLSIIWLPFSLVFGTFRALLPHHKRQANFDVDPRMHNVGYRLGRHFLQLFSTIPHAAFTLVRGITQIAFTPLAWVKMIIRGIHTAAERYRAKHATTNMDEPHDGDDCDDPSSYRIKPLCFVAHNRESYYTFPHAKDRSDYEKIHDRSSSGEENYIASEPYDSQEKTQPTETVMSRPQPKPVSTKVLVKFALHEEIAKAADLHKVIAIADQEKVVQQTRIVAAAA